MLLAVEIDRINKLMILVDSDVDTLHDEKKYSRWWFDALKINITP
jgi:hypothetical protein